MNYAKRLTIIIGISLIYMSTTMAQNDTIPFAQIPDYPTEFTSGAVLQRMIDGLGYRYYWASKDLREEDLNYNPGNEGKSTFETIQHIYDLCNTIELVVKGEDLVRPYQTPELSYEEYRSRALKSLMSARNVLDEFDDLSELKLTFRRGEKTSSFPIWHLINGQLADALYHTGQVVSFRRSSGNPMDGTANVFMGR